MKKLLFLFALLCSSGIALAQCSETLVSWELTPGTFPGEVSFTLNQSDTGEEIFAYAYGDAESGELCLPSGCYSAVLSDSFGDGWNGATLTLSMPIFGAPIGFTYTLEEGYEEVISFPINTDDCETTIQVFGCTNPEAFNFNPEATIDDGSCSFENNECDGIEANITYETCDGSDAFLFGTIVDQFGNEVTFVQDGQGQTFCLQEDGCYQLSLYQLNPDCDYVIVTINGIVFEMAVSSDNPTGTSNTGFFGLNGPCGAILGCTDVEALNYNPFATEDDGSCEYPVPCDENDISISYVSDNWPYENSWEIMDANGNIVYAEDYNDFGSGSSQTSEGTFCIGDGCYTITLNDTFGDGWGAGSLTLSLGDVVQVYSLDNSQNNGEFATYSFGVNDPDCIYVAPVFGCTDSDAINYNPDATSDDGSCVFPCESTTVEFSWEIGSFFSETGFSVTDLEGNEIFSYIGYGWNQENIDFGAFCLDDGCYILELTDTWGDGWNGAVLSLTINGETSTYELANGNSEISSLSIGDSDCEEIVPGCTDSEAANYDETATYDNGTCYYPPCPDGLSYAQLYICPFSNGQNLGVSITNSAGEIVFETPEQSSGYLTYYDLCLDPNECYTLTMENTAGENGWYGGFFWIQDDFGYYLNESLDNDAVTESLDFSLNGPCGDIYGCTDETALNYNGDATVDDGSCEYPIDCEGLTNISVSFTTALWGSEIAFTIADELGLVEFTFDDFGSNEEYNFNFCVPDGCYVLYLNDSFGDGWNGANLSFTTDNGDVIYVGTLDSGSASAVFVGINSDCEGVAGCTDETAENYNPDATLDDGSCAFNPWEDFDWEGLYGLEFGFNFYPNPASEEIIVNANGLNANTVSTLMVFDQVGKVVLNETLNNATTARIDISGLANGTYIVQLVNGSNVATEKLIKLK